MFPYFCTTFKLPCYIILYVPTCGFIFLSYSLLMFITVQLSRLVNTIVWSFRLSLHSLDDVEDLNYPLIIFLHRALDTVIYVMLCNVCQFTYFYPCPFVFCGYFSYWQLYHFPCLKVGTTYMLSCGHLTHSSGHA